MGGTVEKWKRNPDRWRIRVDAGRHPVTGQRRRLARIVEAPWEGRAGRAVVDRALAELTLEADVLRGDPAAFDGLTFADLAQRWLDHRSRTVRHNTVKEYRLAVDRAVEVLGNVPAAEVRPVLLDALYDRLAAQGVPPSAIVKVHRTLKALFFQAVRWQIVATNPALGADPPAAKTARITPPDDDVLGKAFLLL